MHSSFFLLQSTLEKILVTTKKMIGDIENGSIVADLGVTMTDLRKTALGQ